MRQFVFNKIRFTGSWIALVGLLAVGCIEANPRLRYFTYEYHKKKWFPGDKYEILQKSTSGDERADALTRIKEPIRHGGSPQDQERAIAILRKAGSEEPEVWARLCAINAMSKFKDPRIVKGLEDAYYAADQFPENGKTIRTQVLIAMGKVGHPDGLKLIKTVLNAPPVDKQSSEEEKRANLDERITAARALAHFQTPESAQILRGVLEKERDLALRSRAHNSLQVVTGKQLPPDASFLDQMLYEMQPNEIRLTSHDEKEGREP